MAGRRWARGAWRGGAAGEQGRPRACRPSPAGCTHRCTGCAAARATGAASARWTRWGVWGEMRVWVAAGADAPTAGHPQRSTAGAQSAGAQQAQHARLGCTPPACPRGSPVGCTRTHRRKTLQGAGQERGWHFAAMIGAALDAVRRPRHAPCCPARAAGALPAINPCTTPAPGSFSTGVRCVGAPSGDGTGGGGALLCVCVCGGGGGGGGGGE